MSSPSLSTATPIVTLAELPSLMARLAEQIRASGFVPDVVVCVESGARLPAALLCGELGVGAVSVRARRMGHALKALAAPLVGLLPRSWSNALRRFEERSGVHARGDRRVEFLSDHDFRGQAVLVVDDAADTGGTLAAVKRALIGRGTDPGSLRCAVLTATTPPGRAQADYHVLELNSVLPWSADSAERREALARMKEIKLPAP